MAWAAWICNRLHRLHIQWKEQEETEVSSCYPPSYSVPLYKKPGLHGRVFCFPPAQKHGPDAGPACGGAQIPRSVAPRYFICQNLYPIRYETRYHFSGIGITKGISMGTEGIYYKTEKGRAEIATRANSLVCGSEPC